MTETFNEKRQAFWSLMEAMGSSESDEDEEMLRALQKRLKEQKRKKKSTWQKEKERAQRLKRYRRRLEQDSDDGSDCDAFCGPSLLEQGRTLIRGPAGFVLVILFAFWAILMSNFYLSLQLKKSALGMPILFVLTSQLMSSMTNSMYIE